ncbi:conserved exported protein of unknown function [Nitrosopumilus adriaticus]|uniref:Uncharacterized protein n=2 Tax=Nitrosopumilus adriaticus TaxID=1580092 RepID=A0A0D5C3M7_9ARCH|nr:conserved exported protein of unknown function [Nitrosopumilus adriaticus]
MNPMFGFTIGGIMMIAVIMVLAFSIIGSFTSVSSEKSLVKEVNSALRMDEPDMCMKFDNPQECISNFAYMKRSPQTCLSYIEDEENQYECLGKFFRKFQDRVCNYVAPDFYDKCIVEAQKWKQ